MKLCESGWVDLCFQAGNFKRCIKMEREPHLVSGFYIWPISLPVLFTDHHLGFTIPSACLEHLFCQWPGDVVFSRITSVS